MIHAYQPSDVANWRGRMESYCAINRKLLAIAQGGNFAGLAVATNGTSGIIPLASLVEIGAGSGSGPCCAPCLVCKPCTTPATFTLVASGITICVGTCFEFAPGSDDYKITSAPQDPNGTFTLTRGGGGFTNEPCIWASPIVSQGSVNRYIGGSLCAGTPRVQALSSQWVLNFLGANPSPNVAWRLTFFIYGFLDGPETGDYSPAGFQYITPDPGLTTPTDCNTSLTFTNQVTCSTPNEVGNSGTAVLTPTL